MTGFGRGVFETNGRRYRVEIRSVNHRALDVKFRLPWHSPALENAIHSLIRTLVSRGRIDVVFHEAGEDAVGETCVTTRQIQEVRAMMDRLTHELNCDLQTAATLIGPIKEWLVSSSDIDDEKAIESTMAGCREALSELVSMREREGAALTDDVEKKIDRLIQLVVAIEREAATEAPRHLEKLRERVRRLVGELEGEIAESVTHNDARLLQELAFIADRVDVNEEIARLKIHCDALRAMVASTEPIGRKIDFMLQEVHRELNTVASKSQLAQVVEHVVEAKNIVDQLREQIQNVE